MARLPKIRPRTKHINQSYHFFHEAVERDEVSIVATHTENQLAEEPFVCHHKTVLGDKMQAKCNFYFISRSTSSLASLPVVD